MSEVTHREQCPRCAEEGRDSKGNHLGRFSDGGGYCVVCQYHEHGSTSKPTPAPPARSSMPVENLRYGDIPERRLSEKTCRKFGYLLGNTAKGEEVHLAKYRGKGDSEGWHVRYVERKGWGWSPSKPSETQLWGQHLWRGTGKEIRITEGEIDAMSLWQSQGGDWPVVSLPNGAQDGVSAVKQNLSFLSGYDKVTLVLDSDEEGRKAAKAIAEVLPPGKCYIATLQRKDASEYLVAGKTQELLRACWEAQEYRPDGILRLAEVPLMNQGEDISAWKWPFLTAKTLGRCQGDISLITSGSGMGKSSFVREMILADIEAGDTVGVMMLEESPADTLADLIGLVSHTPYRRSLACSKLAKVQPEALEHLGGSVPHIDEARVAEAKQWMHEHRDRVYVYDHWGSLDSNNLISRMEYLATGLGCRKLYLDHITIAVSGNETTDERKDLDVLMTRLRSLVERTGAHLTLVSHLSKSRGTPYEEGGRVQADSLRGTTALKTMSDDIIALERNQQAEDEDERNTVTVRVLKARRAGTTGVAGKLRYDFGTGRLVQADQLSPRMPEMPAREHVHV